ncbi:MAG TPA: hypothetical protein VEU96_11505 [Bryobacteraceae bacterium]|nr:hypothetical protein [Bryobacteraceae bacterium]
MTIEDLLDRLREFDLLADTDPKFPSITTLVVGDSVRGSWWTHPAAREVFRLSCALRDHPDVLMVKLISGKVTAIHRPLWPAILAIGTAREPWQMDKLSKEAKALLKKVDKETRVEATGDAVRELEKLLLVQAESYHTESGNHAKAIQTWQSWAASKRLRTKLTASEAKQQLEKVVDRLNNQFAASGKLPWKSIGVHRRSSAANI